MPDNKKIAVIGECRIELRSSRETRRRRGSRDALRVTAGRGVEEVDLIALDEALIKLESISILSIDDRMDGSAIMILAVATGAFVAQADP